ncbi:TPA: rRNA maturation RNase YbeY [Patescibacteria group bacterium]|nr:MAG: putative rRNA maturation factor [Parcubacteria group bacterium GW2011_GWA2_46_39]HBV33582.1 rRNA maturation RNase YbeY [Patescibacteria group bacterium]HCU48108.1 rRNA maturation RNase YbeY [Patescibacteria group bacterium]
MVDVINNSHRPAPRAWPVSCRNMAHQAMKVLKIGKYDIAVTLVEPAAIKKLNKRYRKHNQVTDVLSFTYDLNKKYLNGEIIICLSQAKTQSLRRQHSLLTELQILTAHGLIHLGGYDHMIAGERRQMRVLEKKVLGKTVAEHLD